MNNEEIINALKIIKNECNSRMICDNCPFSDKNRKCKILHIIPSEWDINEETDAWRALK